MYFHITADSVELVDPQDVKAFSAVCPLDLADEDLVTTVQRAGLGELLPRGEHLMISVEAIRRLVGDRVRPSWSQDLAKMIDYATSKGWASTDGSRIRAHIERR
ncbi:hypothetical protein AB0D13_39175 [Streptomyces sp. NPDC048430]|uniref:hypothetical protein n=1 Tax=Streptomyces sp. NPDC048430 TaxID=3155388 RepID=UPI00341F6A2E